MRWGLRGTKGDVACRGVDVYDEGAEEWAKWGSNGRAFAVGGSAVASTTSVCARGGKKMSGWERWRWGGGYEVGFGGGWRLWGGGCAVDGGRWLRLPSTGAGVRHRRDSAVPPQSAADGSTPVLAMSLNAAPSAQSRGQPSQSREAPNMPEGEVDEKSGEVMLWRRAMGERTTGIAEWVPKERMSDAMNPERWVPSSYDVKNDCGQYEGHCS